VTECSIPFEGFEALYWRLDEKTKQNRLAYSGTIEVTPYCNMKCVHCYVANCHWEENILSYAEICRILDEIAEEGCLWLLLTGGEPFLRKDFLDIYAYAKKKGVFVTIFTNGTLITPEIARYLHDYPPRLVEISIYGATSATHESITGVTGSFKRCLRGIELLLEQGIRLNLKAMAMTLNKHEYWEMKKLAENFGVFFKTDFILNPALDGSRQPCDLRLTPEEVVRFDIEDPERREAWIKTYQSLPELPPCPDTLYVCGAGLAHFHIDSFGRLQPCIIARQPGYDLRQGLFREGWRNFLPSVVTQKQQQSSPCRTCQYRVTCPVCPGWTQLEYGTSEVQPVEYLCQIERLRAIHFGMAGETTDDAVVTDEGALSCPLGKNILPEELCGEQVNPLLKGGGRH
jgi:radical SAM protein with 4Fe4S-binding SPASM domain